MFADEEGPPGCQGPRLTASSRRWRLVEGPDLLAPQHGVAWRSLSRRNRRQARPGKPPSTRSLSACSVLSGSSAAGSAATGCAPAALHHGSRRATAGRAREGAAYLALEVCGYAGPAVADLLGVWPSAVYRAAQRGCAHQECWGRLLKAGEAEKTIRKRRMTGLSPGGP
jgi:hypothetical protein